VRVLDKSLETVDIIDNNIKEGLWSSGGLFVDITYLACNPRSSFCEMKRVSCIIVVKCKA